MGLIVKLLSAIVLITLLPGLPPYTTFPFTEFSVAPLKKLEGPLAINRLLDDVVRLLEGRLYGPEALLPIGSAIYTGIYGGQIVRINESHVTSVVRLGEVCDSLADERVCGRPLGLALDTQRTNSLIAVDAYTGIWEVDLVGGDKRQLVSRDLVLDGFGVNRKPRLFNSVAVAKNGDIYWTESSSDFDLEDAVSTFLANPSGRLFKYDRQTKKNTVLLDQLYFANGVALSPGLDRTSGSSAMHAVYVGEFLYLGSVRNRFVGRVRLPPGLVPGAPASIHEKIPDDLPRPKQGKLRVIRKGGELGEL